MTRNTVTLRSATPVVPVDDMAEATAFYRDRLGFQVAFEMDGYCGIVRDDVMLHLDASRNPDAGMISVRIDLDGVAALHAQIDPSILDELDPLGEKPWGTRQFSVRDPSGNRITFVLAR